MGVLWHLDFMKERRTRRLEYTNACIAILVFSYNVHKIYSRSLKTLLEATKVSGTTVFIRSKANILSFSSDIDKSDKVLNFGLHF